MYKTITKYVFECAFQEIRPNNFSDKGIEALFAYFEQLEEDMGEPIELDVIAICCDYSEMTLKEINQDYSREYETMDEATECLTDLTNVIPIDNDSLILQSF